MRSPNLLQRLVIAVLISAGMLPILSVAAEDEPRFHRVRTQFIAALGDPTAVSGSGAQNWGVWRVDPGPRGVWLKDYDKLIAAGGIGPGNWQFDQEDWWVDENGLLMAKPQFPVPPGKYVVTGDRSISAILTIHPSDENGDRRWELSHGAQLYDVTHLPCRSARYTATGAPGSCSPANAVRENFPVKPGATMPPVKGCQKQDYAVLFLVGIATGE